MESRRHSSLGLFRIFNPEIVKISNQIKYEIQCMYTDFGTYDVTMGGMPSQWGAM